LVKIGDRAVAWVLAALLAAMALPLLIGPLLPEPEGAIRDGFGAVALFWGIAFAYGAAAVLQNEHRFFKRWRPGWTQGFVVTWLGGWTVGTILTLIRLFAFGGPAAIREFIGPALILWGLFVAAPVVGGWMLASRRGRYQGWLRD
jgi:hypothetical protein